MSSSSSHSPRAYFFSEGLSIPDINVWLALAAPEHPHNSLAERWWRRHEGPIAFARLSQLGLLRLTTTAAAMGGKPLTIDEAWSVYDRFYDDDRVTFVPEPSDVEKRFPLAERLRQKSGAMHGCWRWQAPRAASW